MTTPAPTTTRAPLTATDPAVQTLESAHQILLMIGANPRAIRPLLVQRRLTKEAIMEAATACEARATAQLAALDTAAVERRAAYDALAAEARAEIEAEAAGDRTAQLEAHLAAATAAVERFQADAQTQRAFLTGLRDRAEKVLQSYQAV